MHAETPPLLATSAVRPRRRDFPGWHMVWTLSATCTVAYGVLFYAFAVFVVPMRADLGATTGQLSGALSLAIAVNGAAAVGYEPAFALVTTWFDRDRSAALLTLTVVAGYGPALVAVAGCALAAAALLVAAERAHGISRSGP